MAKKSTDVEVLFNKPVCKEITGTPPSVQEMAHSVQTAGRVANDIPFEHRQAIVQKCRADGFDERAIVARHHHEKPPYMSTQMTNWGIVTQNHTWTIGNKPWAPLTIKWFTGEESEMFPHDLILIHKTMSQWEAGEFVRKYVQGQAV